MPVRPLSSARPVRCPTLLALAMAMALAFLSLPAMAQEDSGALTEWRSELNAIERSLRNRELTSEQLSALRARAEPVRSQANALAGELAPRLQAMRQRLEIDTTDESGAEPGPDEDASPDAQAPAEPGAEDTERATPASGAGTLGELEERLTQARLVAARAEDLFMRITERRRELLVSQLLERSPPIIDPVLWMQAGRALPDVAERGIAIAEDWAAIIFARGASSTMSALALAFALALVMAVPVRLYLLNFTRREPEAVDVDMFSKAGAATWITVVNTLLPTASITLVYAALDAFALVPAQLDTLIVGLIVAVAIGCLMAGLSRGLLAPWRTAWRLVPLGNDTAERLHLIVLLGAMAFAFGVFGTRVLDLLLAPQSLTALWRASFAVFMAGFIIAALRTLSGSIAQPDDEEPGTTPSWGWVMPLFWLVSMASVIASFLGFSSLGSFLITQIVWSSALLALLFLLLVVVDEFFSFAFQPQTTLGHTISRTLRLSTNRIQQFGVVLSGLLRLVLIAGAALLMLGPYGLETGDLLGWLDTLFTGLRFAGITLSPAGILAAIVLFVVGLAVTRGIQRWLDTRLLPHTKMDTGIRNSVTTGIGYLGVIVAGVIAGGSLGLNLSNVALVAGALSVGIGFGLQSIVNNFVSGLILLAERPIKAGDWIVVGAEQGIVKRINVRATEIETFDRATVIVPNSDLIAGVVKNWMHGDKTGRVDVPVSVSRESDPNRVRDILLEIAQEHSQVLIYPEPFVWFMNFGESSLDFSVYCFTSDVNNAFGIASDLRFAIYERLKSEVIEIPVPKRNLTVSFDDIDRLENTFRELARTRRGPVG